MIITVIVKEPFKKPEVKLIDNSLEQFQELVGGDIETLDLDNDILAVVNESGKTLKLDGNLYIPEYEDCICGNCVFCSAVPDEEDFNDLNKNQVEKLLKYIEKYQVPENFDIYNKSNLQKLKKQFSSHDEEM